MCARDESRPMEAALRFLLKPVAAVAPTAMTTPTTTLAKAMVNCAVSPTNESVEIFDNRAIFILAGELKGKQDKKDGTSAT